MNSAGHDPASLATEDGVPGVAGAAGCGGQAQDGVPAMASISTFMPGTINSLIPISQV